MHRLILIGVISFCAACTSKTKPEAPTTDSAGQDKSNVASAAENATSTPPAQSDHKPNGVGTFQHDENATHKDDKHESKIEPTEKLAAVKFFVQSREDESKRIKGVVISLQDATGNKIYLPETDEHGYAEALVPVGRTYEVVFLSLGRKKIAANLEVENESRLTLRLTLRYRGWRERKNAKAHRFVIDGIQFESGKATIRPSSIPKLDNVLEFMKHKPSAKIEVSGHTDNRGQNASNQKLSENRAKAVKAYLVSKGIGSSRIKAVGYGPKMPIANNATTAGRQKNRRIEVTEL